MRGRFNRNVQKNVLGFLRGQITLVIFLGLVLAIAVGVLDAIPGIGATLWVITAATLVLLTQGQWLALQAGSPRWFFSKFKTT